MISSAVEDLQLLDITCIRSIDSDWYIHAVLCCILPLRFYHFNCILKVPGFHVRPQHLLDPNTYSTPVPAGNRKGLTNPLHLKS